MKGMLETPTASVSLKELKWNEEAFYLDPLS